jgi:hypothetical protein
MKHLIDRFWWVALLIMVLAIDYILPLIYPRLTIIKSSVFIIMVIAGMFSACLALDTDEDKESFKSILMMIVGISLILVAFMILDIWR